MNEDENFYPAALKKIKKIERGLKMRLAQIVRFIAPSLLTRRAKNRLDAVKSEMKAAILASADKAWDAGQETAQRRLAKDAPRTDGMKRPELPPLPPRAAQEPPKPPIPPKAAAAESEEFGLPPKFAQWYEGTLDDALSRYADRVRRDIGAAVRENADTGGTVDELTAKVQAIADGLTGWQAERIARTETMRLWNLGHYERLERSPDLVGYEYSVIMDDRTSHICAAIHGKKVRREDLQFLPPLHPNCRTVILPIYSFDKTPNEHWTEVADIGAVPGFGEIPDVARRR